MKHDKPVIGISAISTRINAGTTASRQVTFIKDEVLDLISDLGGMPIIIPNIPDPSKISSLVNCIDGLVLSGGEDLSPELYGEKLEIVYDNTTKPFDKFMDQVARCYAVILVSLGDVSPNLILDAIRHNKPFILTRETGFYEKLKTIGIFVDPENVDDIADKILYLADEKNYEQCRQKIESFNFTHTWSQITQEFLTVYRDIK